MQFSAELLKAIGAGVALVEAAHETITFANPAFGEWFEGAEPGTSAADVITGYAEAVSSLEDGGSVSFETTVKRRRRELVIAVTVRAAHHDGVDVRVVECQNISRLKKTEAMIDAFSAMTERKARALEREKTQVEKLLLNLMPRSVYEEYKRFGFVAPKLFEPTSVIMLDFVGFTEMAAATDPTVTVAELNDIFTAFDRIAEKEGCERIKTIGDAYLAVAGLPKPNPDHARVAARCAAKMMRYLERRNETHQHVWQARIGVASGPVVGSVVGVQKYIYDVFGPAVNRAARLQGLSEAMEITVGEELFGDVIDDFQLTDTRVENCRGFGDVRVATLSHKPFRMEMEFQPFWVGKA
ncbi:MAG: adenylate/guanylate cyclase domain-containing protein [Pseudomonadota bacterium]